MDEYAKHEHLGSKFSLASGVLLLDRGTDELLIVNPNCPMPLYVKRGRPYVKSYIEHFREDRNIEEIKSKYQYDGELLHILARNKIIVPVDGSKGNVALRAAGKQSTMEKRRGFYSNILDKPNNNMALYLLLSQSCNLTCIYCFNGNKTYAKSHNLKMSEKVAFKAVEKCLDNIASDGRLEIVFFGGEPLLNWELAKEIMIHTEENLKRKYLNNSIHYHLTSNLSIFPQDLISWLRKYHVTVLCNVDGPRKLHDKTRPYRSGKSSYDKTVNNIKRLRKEGIEVALRSTITSYNVDYMLDIAVHHKEIGGYGCAFVPVNAVNSDENFLPLEMLPNPDKFIEGLIKVYRSGIWEPERLFPINEHLKKLDSRCSGLWACGAPLGNTPVVDVNGDIYACIYLVGINRYKLGNLFEDSFPFQNVVLDMMEVIDIDNNEDCKSCDWRYFCRGGCPIGRLLIASNPNASIEIKKYTKEICCALNKEIMKELLWRQADNALHISNENLEIKCV